MTTVEWAALGVLCWKGGGRTAIGRWLVEQGGAWRAAGGTQHGLEAVVAAIDPRLAAPRRLNDARAAGQAAVAAARAADLTVLPWPDPRYPTWLSEIPDPPPVLWLRGDPAALETRAVAVVGSRAGSPYARDVARELGSGLASRGVTVVSGLARGVDAAAHQGALAVDGCTVAVLGSAVDIVYPPEHTGLASEIVRRGALVSELLPGTTPRPAHFPRRNRLISGLSRAVVVVEASERSGSLITARLAAEQGREVMAVPGNVLSGRNRGAHALLKDGAKLVEDVDDILDEIQMGGGCGPASSDAAIDPVLRLLVRGDSYDLDQLIALSGLDGPTLLPLLLDLELNGHVRRGDGGRFSRV